MVLSLYTPSMLYVTEFMYGAEGASVSFHIVFYHLSWLAM